VEGIVDFSSRIACSAGQIDAQFTNMNATGGTVTAGLSRLGGSLLATSPVASGADNSFDGLPTDATVRIRKNTVTETLNAACTTPSTCRAEVQFRNSEGVTDSRNALRARLRIDNGGTVAEGRHDLTLN